MLTMYLYFDELPHPEIFYSKTDHNLTKDQFYRKLLLLIII